MILDKLENFSLYKCLGGRIAKAFDYLNETDLLHTDLGKHEIENDDIFAIVQEYYTKEKTEGKLEGHKKYIDIQYMIDGEEMIGYEPLNKQKTTEVNDEGDYTFYEGAPECFTLKKGMFAVFFPKDLHMPGIQIDNSIKVRKVVVKVKFN